MQETRDTGAERPSGRRRHVRRAIRIPDDDRDDLHELLRDYAEALDERLEQGMRSLHRAALHLMRQLAAEVWRAGGPTASKNLRRNVIAALAQDDTIKGLLAHTDERYQSLRVRLAEMENGVRRLAEVVRDALRRLNERSELLEASRPEPKESGVDPVILHRALAPLAARLDALGDALHEGQSRQRDDLVRFGDRTAEAVVEAGRRIQQGVGAEVQRLEAAVRAETAFGGETAATLRSEITGIAERTGTLLDAMNRDLVARADAADVRLAAIEGTGRELLEAVAPLAELPGRIADLERRQREELDRATRRAREDLEAYATKAAAGIEELAGRIDRGLADMLERLGRIEERQEAGATRLAGLEEAVAEQHARLAAFTRRAGAGLEEVSRRIREGFRLLIQRTERVNREFAASLERELRDEFEGLERGIGQVAERTGVVLDGIRSDLSKRFADAAQDTKDRSIHLITQVVARQAGQHARNLEAVTEALRSLLDSVRKSGDKQSASVERVLRASAGRQETILQEALAALRGAVDEVTSAFATADPTPARAEDATSFTRRLRGVEKRLEQLSQELAGEAALS